MATKRDLVEAHAFSRRRLVTAFLSGAPGGREVEPVRPGRTIVGGLALAVLLLAGAVIAGVFAPRTPADWKQPGLVLSKEHGGPYVITEEGDPTVLRPVINITSAKLILGSDADEPKLIPQEVIDGEQIGGDIGILGAPHDVPSPARLVGSGWTACTAAGQGIRLAVAADPDATPAPTAGLVVRTGEAYHLVAEADPTRGEEPGAHRLALPAQAGARDNMLAALGLRPSIEAPEVSDEWLALFPPGGALGFETFAVTDWGRPAPSAGAAGLPADARIGDVVVDGVSALLLTAGGPAELDPFALAVYQHLPAPYEPRVLTVDGPPNLARTDPPYAQAHWPAGPVAPVTGEHCGQLVTEPGSPPLVRLAVEPGEIAGAVEVPEGTRSVRVAAGGGAYVLSGDWSSSASGSPFLIDARGQAYPLEGAQTAAQLGYADYAAPVVPDSWLQLFDPGVPLSREAALCPPSATPGRACE